MQRILDAIGAAFSPGFEPAVLPALKLPNGNLYLPTLGLLLDLKELTVRAISLVQAADLISGQKEAADPDESAADCDD